nr:right-handed parallel beta-helix repeat-containing protein [Bacteroidota bacterium]
VTCGTSTEYSNPVLVTLNPPFPGGTYTINSALPTSGTNYQSFTDAAAALACGIAGPVVFNVAPNSGPYNEQIEITEIFNSSSTNTVLFNGNGNTITFETTAADRYIIRLNGANYVAFNNLNIVSISADNNFGFHLINDASYNVITNCFIDLTSTLSNTGSTNAGIVISGSTTSAITAGNNGSNNIIINNRIVGGYYGIAINGASAANNSMNNMITNNSIEDFQYYGIYSRSISNSVISNNDIHRPTRPATSLFIGYYQVTSGENNLISSNRFFDSFAGISGTSFSASYAIYHTGVTASVGNENKVINNVIHLNGSNGTIYAIYNINSGHIQYYHNTILLDDPNSTGGTTRGFYQTTSNTGIDIRNNIFSVTRAGTGAKYCLYFNTATSTITSNYNVLHMDAPAGTNHIGYYSGNFTTLSDWQTANSGAYGQNSVAANPQFVNPSQSLLYPLNSLIDNLGTPLGVTNDVTGANRSTTTPDIGAYEFSPVNKDVEIFNLTSSLAPCYGTNDTLKISVINIAATTLDFSQDTLHINWSISGASTASGTASVYSGTLPGGDTIVVNLTNSMNLSAIGMHEISATVNSAWDEIPFNNNTIQEITVDSVYAVISSDSVCSGNDANLALVGSAANIQWQVNDGNGFINITGANQATASYAVTSNMEFRANYCNNKISDTLSVVEINLPAPVTQNDTVCFDNPATLSATGPGTMNWYTTATGGSSIHSGSTYTTTLPATTTFYVEASTSGTGGSDSLLTTIQAGNACGGGSMFNITALSGAITVTGFDVSLTGQVSQTVNVY